MNGMILGLATVAGLTAASAFAENHHLILECKPESTLASKAYAVRILGSADTTIDPSHGFLPEGPQKLVALLTEITGGGQLPLARYAVRHVPANPMMPGNSPSYVGKNVELQLHALGTPRADGLVPATLVAELPRGARIEEQVLCSDRAFGY